MRNKWTFCAACNEPIRPWESFCIECGSTIPQPPLNVLRTKVTVTCYILNGVRLSFGWRVMIRFAITGRGLPEIGPRR